MPYPTGKLQGSPSTNGSELAKFGTHIDYIGVGGFRSVINITKRDAIPVKDTVEYDGGSSGMRREGMIVYCQDTKKTYQLLIPNYSNLSDIDKHTQLANNDNWQELVFGVSTTPTGETITDITFTNNILTFVTNVQTRTFDFSDLAGGNSVIDFTFDYSTNKATLYFTNGTSKVADLSSLKYDDSALSARVAALESNTNVVTKEYVDNADSILQTNIDTEKTRIDTLINGAPSALDTLKEIADQIAADEAGVASILATQQQHTQQLANTLRYTPLTQSQAINLLISNSAKTGYVYAITYNKPNSTDLFIVNGIAGTFSTDGYLISTANGGSTIVRITNFQVFSGDYEEAVQQDLTSNSSFATASVEAINNAIAAKSIDETNLVHKTGDESIAGNKYFTSTLVAPVVVATNTFSVNGLTAVSYSFPDGVVIGSYWNVGSVTNIAMYEFGWQNAATREYLMRLNSAGNLTVKGDITANKFIGDGSQLTNLPNPGDTLTGFTRDQNVLTISTANSKFDLDLNATIYGIAPSILKDADFQIAFDTYNGAPTGYYVNQWFTHNGGWTQSNGKAISVNGQVLFQDFEITNLMLGVYNLNFTVDKINSGYVQISGDEIGNPISINTVGNHTVKLTFNDVRPHRLHFIGVDNFNGTISQVTLRSTGAISSYPFGYDLFVHQKGDEVIDGYKKFLKPIETNQITYKNNNLISNVLNPYNRYDLVIGQSNNNESSTLHLGHIATVYADYIVFQCHGTGSNFTIDNYSNVSSSGGANFAGNVTANKFIGDGSQLTNLPQTDLSGVYDEINYIEDNLVNGVSLINNTTLKITNPSTNFNADLTELETVNDIIGGVVNYNIQLQKRNGETIDIEASDFYNVAIEQATNAFRVNRLELVDKTLIYNNNDTGDILVDLSSLAGNTSTGSSIARFTTYTATTNGAQQITINGAQDALNVQRVETNGFVSVIDLDNYSVSNNVLTISADANIKIGDKIKGHYYK